ncbi:MULTISPECIES: potassium channel family protein [Bacillus]|uniref:potassium channel family protein n=1 Tax=Bacillus TaxID=1386 RepID=UPI0022B7523F|nr:MULTISPECIES: potassium channel family protein [Bacillus]
MLVLLSGTLFYSGVESMSKVDALYFSVMTITTIGHPTLAPITTMGKIFTMIYACVGIGLIFAFIGFLAKHIFTDFLEHRKPNEEVNLDVKQGSEQ